MTYNQKGASTNQNRRGENTPSSRGSSASNSATKKPANKGGKAGGFKDIKNSDILSLKKQVIDEIKNELELNKG